MLLYRKILSLPVQKIAREMGRWRQFLMELKGVGQRPNLPRPQVTSGILTLEI